jgi:hypothetical protein
LQDEVEVVHMQLRREERAKEEDEEEVVEEILMIKEVVEEEETFLKEVEGVAKEGEGAAGIKTSQSMMIWTLVTLKTPPV